MKDVSHHIRKLNRKTIRSVRQEIEEGAYEMPDLPPQPLSSGQKRKQKKIKMRQKKEAHVSSEPTPDERNRAMKKRVPIFNPLNDNVPPRLRKNKTNR